MKQSAKTPLALYTGWFVRILESETMLIGFLILMIFVKEDSSKIWAHFLMWLLLLFAAQLPGRNVYHFMTNLADSTLQWITAAPA